MNLSEQPKPIPREVVQEMLDLVYALFPSWKVGDVWESKWSTLSLYLESPDGERPHISITLKYTGAYVVQRCRFCDRAAVKKDFNDYVQAVMFARDREEVCCEYCDVFDEFDHEELLKSAMAFLTSNANNKLNC